MSGQQHQGHHQDQHHRGHRRHRHRHDEASGRVERPALLALEHRPSYLSAGSTILSERIVEHEIRVPRRVVREEIVDKVVTIPEKVLHEEIVEDIQTVREKIVEVAKPVVREKFVTVPKTKYVERIKQVPEIVYKEVIKRVPRTVVREKVVEVPRVVTKEKFVEVPHITYKDTVVQKVVEVPKYQDEVVLREVKVPQYVDKPVENKVLVEVPNDIERSVPVPVEAISSYEFSLARFKCKREKVPIAIYIPRFIEVPVPEELMEPKARLEAERFLLQIAELARTEAPCLTGLEELVRTAQANDFAGQCNPANYASAIQNALQQRRLGAPITAEDYSPRYP